MAAEENYLQRIDQLKATLQAFEHEVPRPVIANAVWKKADVEREVRSYDRWWPGSWLGRVTVQVGIYLSRLAIVGLAVELITGSKLRPPYHDVNKKRNWLVLQSLEQAGLQDACIISNPEKLAELNRFVQSHEVQHQWPVWPSGLRQVIQVLRGLLTYFWGHHASKPNIAEQLVTDMRQPFVSRRSVRRVRSSVPATNKLAISQYPAAPPLFISQPSADRYHLLVTYLAGVADGLSDSKRDNLSLADVSNMYPRKRANAHAFLPRIQRFFHAFSKQVDKLEEAWLFSKEEVTTEKLSFLQSCREDIKFHLNACQDVLASPPRAFAASEQERSAQETIRDLRAAGYVAGKVSCQSYRLAEISLDRHTSAKRRHEPFLKMCQDAIVQSEIRSQQTECFIQASIEATKQLELAGQASIEATKQLELAGQAAIEGKRRAELFTKKFTAGLQELKESQMRCNALLVQINAESTALAMAPIQVGTHRADDAKSDDANSAAPSAPTTLTTGAALFAQPPAQLLTQLQEPLLQQPSPSVAPAAAASVFGKTVT